MFGATCCGALISMDQTRRAFSLLPKPGQKLEADDGLAQPRLLPGSVAVSSALASLIQESSRSIAVENLRHVRPPFLRCAAREGLLTGLADGQIGRAPVSTPGTYA